MSTNHGSHDKRELLKLKQGLIEDSDIIKKEEPEKIKLHGKKAIENFFYHNKVTVLMVCFFTIMAGFFIYEAVSKKNSDIDFLLLAATEEAAIIAVLFDEQLGQALGLFTPNFDGNSYVYARPLPINMWGEINAEMIMANQTRLFAELRGGQTRIVIGDRASFERLSSEQYDFNELFVNLEKLYTRSSVRERIVDEIFYKLKGSALAKEAGIDEYCPEDMYIAVLFINDGSSVQQRSQERALEVFDNIVNGRIINNKDKVI